MSVGRTKMGSFLGMADMPFLPISLVSKEFDVACDVANVSE